MVRVTPLVLAVLIAVGAVGLPSPVAQVARAASPVGVGDIVAGSVNRSSLRLEATYAADLRLAWSSRGIWVNSTATIRNTSGAAIDRVELNTVAARLGGLRLSHVTVDGVAVKASINDQTIVVPLGGILPAGGTVRVRVQYAAKLRATLSASNWMFTKANGIMDIYRWLPWVSRRIAFARPNHGDPFETPSSAAVRVRIKTDRVLVLATTGDRVSVSADRKTQVFSATDVRDFTVTAAADYRTASKVVGDTTVRVWYRPGTSGSAILTNAVDAIKKLEARLGPYPHRVFKVVQSAGGYGMESPELIWIPTGQVAANRRYLITHETAHQWFYGLVGNDQATEPFADEAAADFVARYVLGMRRGSRCATSTLDRTIYQYSSACYYETVYIQGGNVLDEARKRMGSTVFWTALRGYIEANRNGISTTATLLRALDDATPLDLGSTLFAPRFPRIY